MFFNIPRQLKDVMFFFAAWRDCDLTNMFLSLESKCINKTHSSLYMMWYPRYMIWYIFLLREDTDTISLLGTRLSSCCHFGMSYMPQLGADEDSAATRVAVLLGSHQGPFWVIIGQEPRRFKKFDWSICRTCRWCRRSWKWFSKPMLVCLQRCGSHMTPEALQSVKCYCKSCSWSLAL